MSGSPGSSPVPRRAARRVSRRGLLRLGGAGGLAAAGLLAGCDLDPRATPTPAPPAPDPDERLVVAARAELRGLLRRLESTPGTQGLIASHRIQLRALAGTPGRRRRGAPVLTQTQVGSLERRAADRFEHWAVTCQDGDLARVLASVAAGITMQPVVGETS